MKSLSIQVNKDEYNKDKKFSPMITSPAPELTNTQDGNIGLHLQVPRGGTHLNGVGSELTFCLICSDLFLLQLVSFTVDNDPLTDGECGQNTLTRDFFSTLSSLFTHHIVAQGVGRTTCLHKKKVLAHV